MMHSFAFDEGLDDNRILHETELDHVTGGATLLGVVKEVIKTVDEIVRTVTGGPQA
jgi:hypothetical protein